tara:strand:- start:620 stop:817 length:198 start_codon:yes stop_codon:yes gene_type:complete
MPESVMKKYRQGELPADYSKDTPVGQELDMGIHANDETRPMDFPNKSKKTKFDKSVFTKADERDY